MGFFMTRRLPTSNSFHPQHVGTATVGQAVSVTLGCAVRHGVGVVGPLAGCAAGDWARLLRLIDDAIEC